MPLRRFAGPLPGLLTSAIICCILFACRHQQNYSLSCPPGTRLMGAPPPKGTEVWCQEIINGKPVKDGPFIAYTGGGAKMIQGNYAHGVQQGEWTLWYENGERASVDHYVDGRPSGLHTSWYANGQKAIEGEYQNGKREGVWTRWDPSGLSSQKMVYRGGKID